MFLFHVFKNRKNVIHPLLNNTIPHEKKAFHIIKPLGYALRPNPPPHPHPPTLSSRCNERTTCIMYTCRRSKDMGLKNYYVSRDSTGRVQVICMFKHTRGTPKGRSSNVSLQIGSKYCHIMSCVIRNYHI